jgi:hypothetical protein
MEALSKYTSMASIHEFRGDVVLSNSGREEDVITEPVGDQELVTTVSTQGPHYIYMFSKVMEHLHLTLPFTNFEVEMLNALNVAPTQLHPNGWAFVRAFELVCLGLDLEPRLGVFYHFYHVKSLTVGKPVSISSQPNMGLFTLYASNFKNYKGTFLRVRCGPRLRRLMFDSEGGHLFPFYWTQNPRLIKGVDAALLTPYESEIISFITTIQLFEIKELLSLESDYPSLVLYLRKRFMFEHGNVSVGLSFLIFCLTCAPSFFISERMKTVSPEEWAAILAKAKEKKTQEGNVDPTVALIVKEVASSQGTKRRRNVGANRPAKILKAGSVPKASPSEQDNDNVVAKGDTVVEEVHHKSPPSPPPVIKTAGETHLGEGVKEPSPLGDTFDPEEFIRTHFVLEGNLDRFEAMDVSEIRRVALGYEFKGMMLNHFVNARQEKEAAAAKKRFEEKLAEARESMERTHAISIQELVDSHHEALEQVKATCESRIRASLENKLRSSEWDSRNLTKSRNGLMVALVMAEDDVAEFEEEIVELEKSNSSLKHSLGEKYAEGFAAALEKVKVLFPGLDEATLSEVNLMKFVEDGKLVSRLPLSEGTPKEAAVGDSLDSESH